MAVVRICATPLLLLAALGAAQADPCGAGTGDLRESAAAQAACSHCGGVLAFDGSANDGVGYTVCGAAPRPPQAESTTPRAARYCGEGVGDLRGSAASVSACDACHGLLELDSSAADGLGFTACVSGDVPPQQPEVGDGSAACGEGVGDLRESAEARAACGACQGTLAYDASAADGLGYSACSREKPVTEAASPEVTTAQESQRGFLDGVNWWDALMFATALSILPGLAAKRAFDRAMWQGPTAAEEKVQDAANAAPSEKQVCEPDAEASPAKAKDLDQVV